MTQNPQSQNPQFQAQNPYSMTPPQAAQPAGQYSAQQGQSGQPSQPGQQGYYQGQPQGLPGSGTSADAAGALRARRDYFCP